MNSAAYVGEIVLNELGTDNESMNLRIALGSELGQGYGTEATRTVVAYGLDVIGLHRISLEVYAVNPRAQRVYENAGSYGKESPGMRCSGTDSESTRSSCPSSPPILAIRTEHRVRCR